MHTPRETLPRESALGAYLRAIRRYPLLPPARIRALMPRIRAGDLEARHEVVTANLRLVVRCARQLHFHAPSMDLLDLIQEGNLGLHRAVDRYDPERNTAFSTFAAPWIREGMLRVIGERQEHVVPLPRKLGWDVRRVHRESSAFSGERGRAPTVSELARRTSLPERTVSTIRRIGQSSVSLDAQEDDRAQNPVVEGSLIVLHPAHEYAWSLSPQELRRFVHALDPRDRRIIEQRFGLDTPPQTQGEIARQLGLTHQRVQQLEAHAIARLRSAIAWSTAQSRRHPAPSPDTASASTPGH